jgi:hypothetical protein
VKFFFLEIGHVGYKKIENFMLISKIPTCLSDKMLPKKVKIKKPKKMGLSQIWTFKISFFILTFFGIILSLRQVGIFETSVKFSIF